VREGAGAPSLLASLTKTITPLLPEPMALWWVLARPWLSQPVPLGVGTGWRSLVSPSTCSSQTAAKPQFPAVTPCSSCRPCPWGYHDGTTPNSSLGANGQEGGQAPGSRAVLGTRVGSSHRAAAVPPVSPRDGVCMSPRPARPPGRERPCAVGLLGGSHEIWGTSPGQGRALRAPSPAAGAEGAAARLHAAACAGAAMPCRAGGPQGELPRSPGSAAEAPMSCNNQDALWIRRRLHVACLKSPCFRTLKMGRCLRRGSKRRPGTRGGAGRLHRQQPGAGVCGCSAGAG